ncbi:hypothetical protein E2C01_004116 [Portunus trituberculatus]|uniref:Uncharacterized protein n=1 Tax=Portunus trituberculatus TaxID=210409 RepID=A0A5B7CPS3_PORTR|nr:hypothetical protein [Portunus trituberculatus]
MSSSQKQAGSSRVYQSEAHNSTQTSGPTPAAPSLDTALAAALRVQKIEVRGISNPLSITQYTPGLAPTPHTPQNTPGETTLITTVHPREHE